MNDITLSLYIEYPFVKNFIWFRMIKCGQWILFLHCKSACDDTQKNCLCLNRAQSLIWSRVRFDIISVNPNHYSFFNSESRNSSCSLRKNREENIIIIFIGWLIIGDISFVDFYLPLLDDYVIVLLSQI